MIHVIDKKTHQTQQSPPKQIVCVAIILIIQIGDPMMKLRSVQMETEHQKVQTIQVSMEENKSIFSKQSSRKASVQEFDTESKEFQSQQIF